MLKKSLAQSLAMNEWRQLLSQTHPKFKGEVAPGPTFASSPSVKSPLVESLIASAEVPNDEASLLEEFQGDLEWISPTAKLQKQIENIPDKFGFKIGEVAEYVGVKQYVLRYWEAEFDSLRPKKSKKGQRMYTKRDVETALFIQKLLHEDRFSIEGARTALKRLKKQVREKGKVATAAAAPASKPVTAKEALQTAVAAETAKLKGTNDESLASAKALLAAIQQAKLNLQL